MRRGQQSMPTIRAVEAEVEKINNSNILPPGVRIERIYDRSDLINITTRTVLHNMIFGIVLIFFVQWLFLGNLRSALIVATTIPFALFFAITMLVLRGESANLLSVGAIDFGLVVDATVIMVENIFRRLSQPPERRFARSPILERVRPTAEFRGKFATIANAATEVNQAIFFSAAIIVAGFVPLFTMSGVEGHIFGPMAKTYAYAIAGGLIATFTVTPALSAILLPAQVSEVETLLMRGLHRLYRPVLDFALANRIVTLGGAAAAVGAGGACAADIGPRVPAQARRGKFLDSRDVAAVDLARGGERLCQPDAPADQELPRGRHCRLAERAARRRHRCHRVFQCRIFCSAEAVRHLAQGRRQGKADRGGQQRARGRVSRRRVQLLAIHRGQCRRGGIRGQGRELGQAVRQRSRRARKDGRQDQRGDEHGAGDFRPRGVQFAGPADRPDRDRPRPRRALWPRPRRHQFDDRRGDRRSGGGQPL